VSEWWRNMVEFGGAEKAPEPPAVAWGSVLQNAIRHRRLDECPVCLDALLHRSISPRLSSAHPEPKLTALLSCGHAFHATCINNVEHLSATTSATHSCPVCRAAPYRKRLLDPANEHLRSLYFA
jgi:Ring finger domain